jgi:hypothetical protein
MANRVAMAAVAAGISVAVAAGAQMTSSGAEAQSSAAATARERAITDRYLRTVHTEVVGKIDTHTAKPGQEIAVRVLDDAELADGTRLQKGSRLLGRVLQVQTKTDQQAAALVLVFDRAEVKGSQPVPVRAVIEMVAPVGGVAKAANQPMPMGGGGGGYSAPSVGIADSSSAGMGRDGGVLGNVGRGAGGYGRGSIQPPLGGTGGMDPTGAGMPGSAGGQVGANGTGMGNGQIGGIGSGPVGIDGRDTIGAAGPIGSRPIDDVGAVAGGAVPIRDMGVRPVVNTGEDVRGGARMTAVPGVVLSQTTATGGSGMLMSASHDIRLDSGMQITLGVIRH